MKNVLVDLLAGTLCGLIYRIDGVGGALPFTAGWIATTLNRIENNTKKAN